MPVRLWLCLLCFLCLPLALALPSNGSGDLAVAAIVGGGGSVHLVLDVTGYMAAPAVDLETP